MPKKSRSHKKAAPRENRVAAMASMATTLVTLLFIMTFMGQSFAIPSSSMENTLLIGDHVFVDRIQFAPKTSALNSLLPYRNLHRGDIVVFLSPETPGLYIVKRIIGIPGDRIHLRDGVVYRNGEKLNEPYVLHDPGEVPDEYRDNFPSVAPLAFDSNIYAPWRAELSSHIQDGDLVVPSNSYFGMGDHRAVSLDSRYWGFIPRANIIGRPLIIYWSFESSEEDYLKTGAGGHVALLTRELVHFFDETRWRRTLKIVR